jgi:hypothetical protein
MPKSILAGLVDDREINLPSPSITRRRWAKQGGRDRGKVLEISVASDPKAPQGTI